MIDGYRLLGWIWLLLLTVAVANAAPITVTDAAGRELVLNKPATRIIALAPHIVENVFSAGAGDKLVGVVSYSDYPPQASTISIVGGYTAFSLEKIISLRPDLVITWSEGNGDEASKPFAALGIPVYVDESRKLTDVARVVRNIGLLTGTSAIADAAAEQYLKQLEALETRYRQTEPLSVFYQVWNKPLMTVNGEHLITAVIELCGGHNIFADEKIIATKISVEAVISRDPAVIIASGMDEERPEWLDEWRQFPRLSAVEKNNLYFIPPSILQRQTMRILQGAEEMCRSLEQARSKLAKDTAIKDTVIKDATILTTQP